MGSIQILQTPDASFADFSRSETSIKEPNVKEMPIKESEHPEGFRNLPFELLENARAVETTSFNPAIHLNFHHPSKIHMFADLHQEDSGISPHAVSEPFSLFSNEAIAQMRAEIFSQHILEHYYCETGPSSGQVRGHCPKDAPFINSVWTHPQTLAIVSKIAGVDLVPAIDYDIGHANISVKYTGQENKCVAPGEQKELNKDGYCESSFGWHTDSYPFVVVTMLSDCNGMVGGETAIRMGNGEIMKARGPALGTAVVMQGQCVQHQATPALGGKERISMVTSFRPRSPLIKDGTILRGVRNISHLPTLHAQYAEYRLENLEERVRDALRVMRKRKTMQAEFDTLGVRGWLIEQRSYIDSMLEEMKVM